MKTALLLALIFFAPRARAQDARRWTAIDTEMQVACETAFALDWLQTGWVSRHGYVETNPLLGKRPPVRRVNLYFPLAMMLHAAAAYALPRPWRTVFQGVTIGLEVQTLQYNFRFGIGLTLPWKGL